MNNLRRKMVWVVSSGISFLIRFTLFIEQSVEFIGRTLQSQADSYVPVRAGIGIISVDRHLRRKEGSVDTRLFRK